MIHCNYYMYMMCVIMLQKVLFQVYIYIFAILVNVLHYLQCNSDRSTGVYNVSVIYTGILCFVLNMATILYKNYFLYKNTDKMSSMDHFILTLVSFVPRSL